MVSNNPSGHRDGSDRLSSSPTGLGVSAFAYTDEFTVALDTTGFDAASIQLKIHNGVLRITTNDSQASHGSRRRTANTVELPATVDIESQQATLNNNVLTVRFNYLAED